MRDPVDRLKDPSRERSTPRPDRSEMAGIWFQSGSPDGFSMEWVFDRYDHTVSHGGRQV